MAENTWSEYYKNTLELPDSNKTEHFLSNVPYGGYILDFGAGTGRFSAAFRRDRPDLKIDAVEVEPEAVEIIKNRRCVKRIYQQSFNNFKSDQMYDAIWIMHSLFFILKDDMRDVLCKLAGLLKPNGIIGLTLLEKAENNIGDLTTLSLPEIEDFIHLANLKEVFRKNFGQQFFGAASEHSYEVMYLFLKKEG